MSDSPSHLHENRKDEQGFANLVEEITQKVQGGQRVDVDSYVRKYPEYGGQLRELFPAMRVLADLAASVSGGERTATEMAGDAVSKMGVLGDFRILREIGRGGMGVVYEAEQVSLGRRVALKVLPFAAILDPRQLQRFQNEARAAASLKHPHIVSVHSVGCERGVHYYAMEYVEGKTLAQLIEELRDAAPPSGSITDLLARKAPPDEGVKSGGDDPTPDLASPPQAKAETRREVQAGVSTKPTTRTAEFFQTAAKLGIQAAEALEHAHQMGVVHRDIKPSNLMVDARAHLWITDFGLAQISAPSPLGGEGRGEGASLTMTGDILGTLRYMSPEQAAGRSRVLDHHTDIYSLGVTLYELLTLRPAFEGDDRQRLLCRIVADDPPPPRQHNPSIPRDLETILLKATAKEPLHRYASAQEMADDLRRYLDDKPIRARRPSLVERTAKWSRRHKPVVWSTAVLLLAAVIATVVVAWNRYQKVLQIQQHLTAAGALLQSGDYVAADRELAEARARLDAVFYPSGGLAADLAGLTGQVSGKKEAEERFQRFQEYRQSVHANMYNATPNTIDRVQENCRAALALYRVFDPPYRLEGQEGFELLSPQRRAMLREAVAELLFAWAEMEAAREQEPRDLPESHRRTIAALERIERVYRPIPAVYLWIAQSRRALGEADAARQAEKQAAAHPPASGLDYFILGEFHYMCEDQPEKAQADYSLALRRQPDHYLSLLAAGLTLWDRSRHNEAVAMLTGAIAVNPRTSLAYLWRANSCWKLREFDLAQADLDAAVAIDPRDYGAFWVLAQLRHAQGDDAAALAMWDKAVTLAPATSPVLLLERGQFHVRLGNRDKALADFSRVIEWLRPRLGLAKSIRTYRAMNGDPQAWYIRACQERSQIYKQLGQLDKAADDLKEALRPAPKSVESYDARATVEAAHGEFDKAIADCTEAIRLNPLSSSAYRSRGIVYVEKGDPDRAIADFNEAIRLTPVGGIDYRNRGVAYSMKKDFDRAIADFTEAIRLEPKNAHAYARRGEAYGHKHEFEREVADYTEAIRLNPKYANAYSWRAYARTGQGDFDKALGDYSEAIRLEPKNAPAYTNRAIVYLEKGAIDEALRDVTKALELGKNDADCWRLAAMTRLAAGKLDEYRSTCAAMLGQFAQTENPEDGSAMAWACVLAPDAVGDWSKVVALAERAQKRDPKSPVCQTALGAVLYRAGRFEEAVQRLTEADRLVPEPTERGVPLSPAETWYFLAMAHHRAGHAEEAKKWLDKATAWTDKALREHETRTGPRLDFYRRVMLKRFRAEAADLLGITAKPPAEKEKPR